MVRPLMPATQAFLENYKSFENSGLPNRILFFSSNAFKWFHTAGWRDFPATTVAAFRWAFALKKPSLKMEIDGTGWFIDLQRMMMINLVTSSVQSIAWMDVNKNWFFPHNSKGCIGDSGLSQGIMTGPMVFLSRKGGQKSNDGQENSRPMLPDLNFEPNYDD